MESEDSEIHNLSNVMRNHASSMEMHALGSMYVSPTKWLGCMRNTSVEDTV